jgi:hypothetical protein
MLVVPATAVRFINKEIGMTAVNELRVRATMIRPLGTKIDDNVGCQGFAEAFLEVEFLAARMPTSGR